jgi:hypothetical protein
MPQCGIFCLTLPSDSVSNSHLEWFFISSETPWPTIHPTSKHE